MLFGDDDEEPLPARVVSRERDRVTVQVAIAGISAAFLWWHISRSEQVVLIDPAAVLFLLGTQMDFAVDKLSARFVFRNPNETSACGCGESVTLTPANPEGAESRA